MTNKRMDGRDEPILEPALPIIDTHQHLFLRPTVRYLIDEFLADARAGHRIVASVFVEAQSMYRPDGPELLRSLGEVEFANGMGAACASGTLGPVRACAAIVSHANLSAGDAIAAVLDRHVAAAPERMRGVRQITFMHPSEALKPYMRYICEPGILGSPGFRAGFRHLAPRGLSFDSTVFHTQFDELGDLARAFPDTTIVLGHLGLAMAIGLNAQERQELFALWRDGMRQLAQHPNLVCKVGGLGMPFWGFGFETRPDAIGYLELAEAWRPYVETAIETFGAERCMMESNFPPDGISCGYVPLWNALKHITRNCSAADKAALYHDTAARIYRIEPKQG